MSLQAVSAVAVTLLLVGDHLWLMVMNVNKFSTDIGGNDVSVRVYID